MNTPDFNVKIKPSFKEFISDLVVILFLASTIGVFAPGYIYLNNRGEFDLTYNGLLAIIVPIAIIFFIIIAFFVLLSALKTKYYVRFVSILFAVGFLFWLQGNILIWDYGLLDGRDILWSKYFHRGLVDTSVWLIVLAVALFKSSLVYKLARKVSWAFIVLQLLSTIYIVYQHPETDIPSFKKYEIDSNEKFSFSKDRNVIVLVLDSFQADIFKEIINEAPEYADIYKGFTFYRNTLAGHPFTETSTSLILTGQYYEGLYPFEKHNQIAYLGNSVPRVLKDHGFRVDLYPYIMRSIYFDKSVASNIIRKKRSPDDVQREIAYIYDISLFRIMPHFTKNYIYNNQNWLIKRHPQILSPFIPKGLYKKQNSEEKKDFSWLSIFKDNHVRKNRDINFINSMVHIASADSTSFTFKYYHLGLPHWPLIINEQLEYEKMEVNRQNYKRQAKAALKLNEMFIKKLKEISAFDQSLIFILGDHGAGGQDQVFKAHHDFVVPEDSQVITNSHQINALPLLLVKPAGAQNELRTSDAPVSLSDIPTTIFSQLGIQVDNNGKDIFALKESESRIRRFIDYGKYDSKNDYYPGLMEFAVTGPGWIKQSWKHTGRVFRPLNKHKQAYNLSEPIIFGIEGNAFPYQQYGWSSPEDGFTWTFGKEAELLMEVKTTQSNLTLTADIHPFLVPEILIKQRVNLYINEKKVGAWNVSHSGEYSITYPAKFIKNKSMKIIFELPDAISPERMNVGSDIRPLALAFKRLVISEE